MRREDESDGRVFLTHILRAEIIRNAPNGLLQLFNSLNVRPPLSYALPPPFLSRFQGLEMHGTTILCVRKNGKVVSLQILHCCCHRSVVHGERPSLERWQADPVHEYLYQVAIPVVGELGL